MTEKRFSYDNKTVSILKDGEFWLYGNIDTACNHSEICNKLNKLEDENEQLKSRINDYDVALKTLQDLADKKLEENEQLKKELHLVHMQSMFSTVQSFKGDVSKRYKYSKETDTVYDTANNYGQYDKVLDKAEIVMLLNEYETVLNELNGDVE